MSTVWIDANLQAVDELISQALVHRTATDQGTVQSVQADAFRAMVVFDGTSVAMPVKVSGHVGCVAGDRVCLQRFGSDWVVMAAFALNWAGNNGYSGAGAVGSVAVGAYANMPGTPNFTVTKRWNATRIKWTWAMSAYADAVGRTCVMGVSIDAGATTIDVGKMNWANTGGGGFGVTRMFGVAQQWTSSVDAGIYTARARWKTGGAGTITTDTDDYWSFGWQEVPA